MANEAVINFLFNSEGATRELSNFKTKFDNALKAIEDSGVGKFTAIGSAIAGAFSIKKFVDYTHTMADFNAVFSNIPLERVGRFANLMKLLNREADYNQSIEALTTMQKKINQLRTQGGEIPKAWGLLGITGRDEQGNWLDATEVMDEVITKYRKFQQEAKEGLHPAFDTGLLSEMFDEMGLSKSIQVSLSRIMNASEEEFAKTYQTVGGMFTPGKADADNVLNFEQALTKLESAFNKLGRTLLTNGFITGAVNAFADAVNRFTNLPDETQEHILAIGTAFVSLAPAVKILRAIASFANPWTMLAGAILAVATNIGGARDKIEELKKKYDLWVDDLTESHPFLAKFFEQIGDLINAVLHPIETFKQAWDGIKQSIKDIIDLLPQMFGGAKLPEGSLPKFAEAPKAQEGEKSPVTKVLDTISGLVNNGLEAVGVDTHAYLRNPETTVNNSKTATVNVYGVNYNNSDLVTEAVQEGVNNSMQTSFNWQQMGAGYSGGRF